MKKIELAEIGEMVSLIISTIIILGLAGFLIYGIVRPETPFIAITGFATAEMARQQGDSYIMPIRIANDSNKTINYLKLRISLKTQAEEGEDIEIDYLSSHSSRDIYAYFTAPVAREDILITPLYYKFD